MQECQSVVFFAEYNHVVSHGLMDDPAGPALAVDAGNAFDEFAEC